MQWRQLFHRHRPQVAAEAPPSQPHDRPPENMNTSESSTPSRNPARMSNLSSFHRRSFSIRSMLSHRSARAPSSRNSVPSTTTFSSTSTTSRKPYVPAYAASGHYSTTARLTTSEREAVAHAKRLSAALPSENDDVWHRGSRRSEDDPASAPSTLEETSHDR
ncbi:MAG: hypothetical protein M1833_004389 [Piccolia ochrophora]|nr:MAG: hypothetical protein M1833_004389 [Piccolia ochrophora]